MLASASKYMLNVFKAHDVKTLKKVSAPLPFPTDSSKVFGQSSDEPILKILKYLDWWVNSLQKDFFDFIKTLLLVD